MTNSTQEAINSAIDSKLPDEASRSQNGLTGVQS